MKYAYGLLASIVCLATSAAAGELTGTASYRERIALPPEAQFQAILYDISGDDQVEIARSQSAGDQGPPYNFMIDYPDAAVTADGQYALRAQVIWSERPFFVADTTLDGLVGKADLDVTLVMMRPGADQANAGPLGSGVAPVLIGGMMTYFADAAVIEDCVSGQTYPVATDGDYLALEAAYLADRPEPGAPLYVVLDGGIELREGMEGPARETVTVVHFVRTVQGITCERQRARASLSNTYWRIDQLDGEVIQTDPSNREAHMLRQDNADNSFWATLGCNQMGGTFESEGNTVAFSPMLSTMMACPPPLDRLETQFGKMLSEVVRFGVTGETLVLSDDTGKPRAVFSAIYF
jgi:heat shock protein HslJ/uncharacterized lipoprotein YbaY